MCGVRGSYWKSGYISFNFVVNLVSSRKLILKKRHWRTLMKSWKLTTLYLGLK